MIKFNSRHGLGLGLLVGALTVGAHSSSALGQDFDSPVMGANEIPCVAIESFSSARDSRSGFVAKTSLRNLCAMAVELQFCLTLTGEEPEKVCTEESLRPEGTAKLVESAETRLIGPTVQWRYMMLQY